LDIITRLHQFIAALVDHVSGEEYVDCFRYRDRDHFVFRVVPVEMHHCEYLRKQLP